MRERQIRQPFDLVAIYSICIRNNMLECPHCTKATPARSESRHIFTRLQLFRLSRLKIKFLEVLNYFRFAQLRFICLDSAGHID